MLNFCDFIQVYVLSTNHHLNQSHCIDHGGGGETLIGPHSVAD